VGTAVTLPPGAYMLVTGVGMTADEAAEHVFPDDALWVLVETQVKGRTVAYTYLIDYPEDGDGD
jgi:hypothetical protein